MKVINQVRLEFDEFEKCFTYVESDCPLGQLYDYASALQSFVLQKMKEQEVKKESEPKAQE